VRKGDLAVDFELPDENGTPRRLTEVLKSGPVVLFFYPGAMTYGCTRESCHFRDLQGEFEAVGSQPIGISADPVEKQKKFSDMHSFGYPLLSDPDGVAAGQFGVRRRIAALGNRRMTFVIDTDLRILEVVASEVSFASHADKALEVLRTRAPA
jgi:thioredoxin-dependent peroxiredoxin